MDDKLLQALSNIGDGLEELVKALEDKKSAKSDTATAVQAGDFGKQLKELSVSVKSIKKDTQEILKQQKTILEISKQKETKSTEVMESDPKKESAIKKGVGSILLIAVAVLAIGLAFKLVGKVDFLSVVGLALAITVISLAFEKLASMKLKIGEVAVTAFAMVLIAAGITVSSFVLSKIEKITKEQALTAILISAAFAALGFSMGKFISALSKENKVALLTTSLVLPIVMLAMSYGIMLSSEALGKVKPLSMQNLWGSIQVGLVFVVLSFGLKKIIAAFKDISPGTAVAAGLMIPPIFLGMSIAIQMSSEFLSKVQPVKFEQLLTSLAIAVIFIPIAYAIKPILEVISKMKWSDLPKVPVLFTIMSIAIVASSHILSLAKPIPFVELLRILVMAVVVVLAVAIVAIAGMFLVKFIGMDVIKKGAVAIGILALTIMVSSILISKGNYDNFPGWKWSVFSALSIVLFGGVSWILNKLGGVSSYIKGGLAIVILSGVIMVSSLILNVGEYKNYPDLDWALGVSLSLAAFGVGAVLLGTQVLNPFFYAGLGMILVVAGTIIATSYILAQGEYGKYPTEDWALGVSIILAAFGVGAVLLGLQVFNPLFVLGLGAIVTVALTINLVDRVFAQGSFKKYPPKEWVTNSVAILDYFGKIVAPIGKILPLIVLATPAIMLISSMISRVDRDFEKGQFKKFPSKKWVEGASSAITTMSQLMNSMSIGGALKSLATGLLGGGIDDIARKIVLVDKILSKGNYKNIPPMGYMSELFKNIKTFTQIQKYLSQNIGIGGLASRVLGLDPISQTTKGMIKMAKGFDVLANSLKKFSNAVNTMNLEKIKVITKLTGNMAILSAMDSEMFERVLQVLDDKASVFSKIASIDSVGPSGVSPSVAVAGTTGKEIEKKGKYGTMQEQLDQVIDLLTTLNVSTAGLDEFLSTRGGVEKKQEGSIFDKLGKLFN